VWTLAGTLIKKRHFWPTLVLGQEIDEHCLSASNLEVGECKAVQGMLDEETNMLRMYLGSVDVQ
jgi:hypothetical protein